MSSEISLIVRATVLAAVIGLVGASTAVAQQQGQGRGLEKNHARGFERRQQNMQQCRRDPAPDCTMSMTFTTEGSYQICYCSGMQYVGPDDELPISDGERNLTNMMPMSVAKINDGGNTQGDPCKTIKSGGDQYTVCW